MNAEMIANNFLSMRNLGEPMTSIQCISRALIEAIKALEFYSVDEETPAFQALAKIRSGGET